MKNVYDINLNQKPVVDKVTEESIALSVAEEKYFILDDNRTTICQITMENGFTVLGTASVVDIRNFDVALGRQYAHKDAYNKLFELEGYLLKQQIWERENNNVYDLFSIFIRNLYVEADLHIPAQFKPEVEIPVIIDKIRQGAETSFDRVAHMNEAFFNKAGDPRHINWARIHKQCLNIVDELGELFIAFGGDSALVKHSVNQLKTSAIIWDPEQVNLDEVRDALCDIHVFAYGAHHMMGINADADMKAVVDGVMTRFVKDDADLMKTMRMHSDKGVTEVYTEGEFPTMVLKSAVDQPDAPKGKFLKSASFKNTVFPDYSNPGYDE